MRVEFHVHTRYSKDSILNGLLILFMCKIKKIGCIAITDHNEIKGAIKYKKYLENHGIQVIVGEEIFTSGGEIVGLFLKEKIDPNLSPKDTIDEIISQNGLVYIPHPYDEKRNKSVLKECYIKEFVNQIDFIEIHNGRNIDDKYDIKQSEMSKKYNILPIVGSDAHIFWELGRNYLVVNDIKVSKENLIEEIKNAKYVIKKCRRISHSVTKYVKAFKMLFKGDIDELYRIIIRRCKK